MWNSRIGIYNYFFGLTFSSGFIGDLIGFNFTILGDSNEIFFYTSDILSRVDRLTFFVKSHANLLSTIRLVVLVVAFESFYSLCALVPVDDYLVFVDR